MIKKLKHFIGKIIITWIGVNILNIFLFKKAIRDYLEIKK